MTSCLPFHKKAADELGCNLLGGAGEEGLGDCLKVLGERGVAMGVAGSQENHEGFRVN